VIYTNKLKPLMQIKTKFHNELWNQSILISIKDGNLIIPILEEQINNSILEHDFIKVAFSLGRIEITYLCIVEKIMFEENLKMSLKILKEEFWTNTRSAERIEVNFVCKIILGQNVVNSYVTDISLTGCRIISSEQLVKNNTYTICIFKENKIDKNCIKLYGDIKRRCVNNTKLEYGIQFLNTADKELEELSMILERTHNRNKNIIEKLINKYS